MILQRSRPTSPRTLSLIGTKSFSDDVATPILCPCCLRKGSTHRSANHLKARLLMISCAKTSAASSPHVIGCGDCSMLRGGTCWHTNIQHTSLAQVSPSCALITLATPVYDLSCASSHLSFMRQCCFSRSMSCSGDSTGSFTAAVLLLLKLSPFRLATSNVHALYCS